MRLQGTFVDTPLLGQLLIYDDYILEVNKDGFIVSFAPISEHNAESAIIIPQGSFVLPTFTDLHLHAPQFMYQGTGLDLPLLEWLDKYTYKAEEQLDADPILAARVYQRLAQRLVENGTGAVSLFGTIKEETNLILARELQNAGLRARVGKLSMDISSRPTYVEQSVEASLASASSFVDQCLLVSQFHQRLVEPVLTPRFVPTCSDSLLKRLGDLASSRNLPIQSHLAESHDQMAWVQSTRGKNDIDIFAENRLLNMSQISHGRYNGFAVAGALVTRRSVGWGFNGTELSTIQEAGSSIAHCPLSNVYFSVEPFPLREALSLQLKVGLGTDVAGGYSMDMMNSMRNAVLVSRMRENARQSLETASGDGGRTDSESLAITWKESIYLATRGGAIALGLSAQSGTFAVGAPFDAQQIQLINPETQSGTGALDFFDLPTSGTALVVEPMIEKWWCIGDHRNHVRVWVQGKQVL